MYFSDSKLRPPRWKNLYFHYLSRGPKTYNLIDSKRVGGQAQTL